MPDLLPAPLRQAPPEGITRLFLIRHGSTAANEQRPFILQGCEMNGPLSELGQQQAQSVSQALREFRIHAVYASPLRRAMETAAAIAQPHGLAVSPVPDIRECSVGAWEGKSWDLIRETDPDGYDDFFSDPVNRTHPGGESYSDVLRRVEPAINRLLEQHSGQNIVIVAHNLVNRVYLAGLAGIELKHARKLRQMNCCINLLQHFGGETQLITLNSVLHHDLVGFA